MATLRAGRIAKHAGEPVEGEQLCCLPERRSAWGGTTAAAALKLGRRIIGIDIDRKHIEVTRRRIESVLKPCGAN
jgi:hypothetical protein